MLYKLLSHTCRQNFDSAVVSLTDVGPIGDRIKSIGYPVYSLGLKRPIDAGRAFLRLKRKLQDLRPSLIQTWLYHADLLGGLAGRLAGRIPVVWNLRQGSLDRSLLNQRTHGIAKICALLSMYLPNRIVCCSESVRAAHVEFGYYTSNMTVIYNGFDLNEFHPDKGARTSVRNELGLEEKTILVGLVARFDPFKDHRTFIRSAGQVLQNFHRPDLHFVLCGSGITSENEDLIRWIQETGHAQRFHLLGPRNDVARLNAAFDMAVSSSLSEGFPNALGEAMACGTPCVATAVGESAFIIGDTGLAVNRGCAVELAGAIIQMLNLTDEARQERGRAARDRISRLFSLQGTVRKYEDLYSNILNGAK
jgi:glycosyltransferase involved in cell wall biosynthesis